MKGLFCAVVLLSSAAFAQAAVDRVTAAGYYRIMARPDFQGGVGQLGFWNLTGRLLNEGPYVALELNLAMLQAPPGSSAVWADLHARIEGASIGQSDPGNGLLNFFRLSQFYARAGNILIDKVTWQLGTLRYYFGQVGIYDLRPATLFLDTVGLSGTWSSERLDVLVGAGDSGFATRGFNYAPILTAGVGARVRVFPGHLELGAGAQVGFEPFIEGDKYSSYVTPDVQYADYLRHEVVKTFDRDHFIPNVDPASNHETLFNVLDRPLASKQASVSWRAMAMLGFGNLGPLRWNNLFVNYQRLHPDNFTTESYAGHDYTIYTADLTRDRYQLQVVNEAELTLWPEHLDAVWGVLYGNDTNYANLLQAGEDNRTYVSTVLRLQLYLTRQVHLLLEGGLGQEHSKNGNLWRNHVDSTFQNTGGVPDTRGLEYGDAPDRTTVQLKGGIVFNPTGTGIYARPSIRLIYGAQWSSMQAAFGNGFSTSLDQFDFFPGVERHWHHLIALESEGWF